jgi:predicted peptidase
MGGFGSWNLAARHPDWFAAVVPICGGGDPSMAKVLADVPIWAFHGADDKVVQPGLSRSMIDAIRDAGGKPKYTELEGVGHNSWTPAYEDRDGVLPWMFSKVNDRPKADAAQ